MHCDMFSRFKSSITLKCPSSCEGVKLKTVIIFLNARAEDLKVTYYMNNFA